MRARQRPENAYRHAPAGVTDFYDKDQIVGVYYPQVEALLKAAKGAEKVVIFDHTIRSIPKFREGVEGICEPVRRVHNDYTATSGRRRVNDHLDPAGAEERLTRRFAEINVWRPIRGPLEDSPLAVCHAQTIAPSDLIPSDLIYRDKVGETYSVSYNPEHRCFYFPRLQVNEAILIKCFDSEEDARARFTAHSAFDDPTTPATAIPAKASKCGRWCSSEIADEQSRAIVCATLRKELSPQASDPTAVLVETAWDLCPGAPNCSSRMIRVSGVSGSRWWAASALRMSNLSKPILQWE